MALVVALVIVGGLVALCCCRDAHESTTALSADPAGLVQVDDVQHRVTTATDAPVQMQLLGERLVGTVSHTDSAVSGSEQCAPEPTPGDVATTTRALGDVPPPTIVGGTSVQVTQFAGRLSPPASAGGLPDEPAHLLCVMRT